MTPAEGAAPDPTGAFLQYGIVGVVALLALYGLVKLFNMLQKNNEREVMRADRAEAELKLLNDTLRDNVIAQLTRATDATARVLALFDERRP
jgi:hypothetical protein